MSTWMYGDDAVFVEKDGLGCLVHFECIMVSSILHDLQQCCAATVCFINFVFNNFVINNFVIL